MAPVKYLAVACLLALGGCAPEPRVQPFTPPYPDRLSDWQLFSTEGGIEFAPGVTPYHLNLALFSDYAHKLRTVYMPPGSAAAYDHENTFQFPVGTIVSKTFFYFTTEDRETMRLSASWDGDPRTIADQSVRLIETRLLVKQTDHWDALPYLWQGDDAYLAITGGLLKLNTSEGAINYLVPSRNQCASCHATNHTTGEILPIGLKARHLNRSGIGETQNQLTSWHQSGRLTGLPQHSEIPRSATLATGENLDDQARSYLDINCGHCHNSHGAADTSGLLLDLKDHSLRDMGACKPPIAAGRGSGGRFYSIVPGKPGASILRFRMASSDPAEMMPELGRTLVHKEGVALIDAWIRSLSGRCL